MTTPALAQIQRAWAAAEARQFSACEHCDHHRWQADELRCGCPTLMWAGRAQRVAIVRLPQGGCGPEALHMSAPWLREAANQA
jgi:hypothetical protein